MKTTTSVKALWALALGLSAGLAHSQTIPIQEAGDFGGTLPNYPAANAIDGNTSFSSRWSADLGGSATNLFVDFGSVQRIDDVGIAWGRGNERTYRFEIRARAGTSGSWTRVFSGTSSGNTSGLESYNVTDMDARQVRIKTFSNSAGSTTTDITEFEVYGSAGRSGANAGNGNNNNDGTSGDNGGNTTGNTENSTSSVTSNTNRTVLFEKNGFSFAIDGAGGAQQGIQVYLWNTNTNNANQHWVETEIDNRFYQYRKANTNLCWDAGDGGARLQAIRLQPCDVNNRNQHWELISLANGTVRLKKRSVSFSIDGNNGAARRQVIYLWNSSNNNANQQWRIVEIDSGANNGGNTGNDNPGNNNPGSTNPFGLDPNREPWENFDLSDWVIDTPAFASDGESQRFGELRWDEISNESRQFFFTHTDGGMRFVTRLDGARTSANTSFVRSELREMLRAGDTSIRTTGVNGNNWRLGHQPGNASDWGGTNGTLTATLRVNKVTTTGNGIHVGRTIIGQIHASSDEPARLYYRKEPDQELGCIYLSHEIRDGRDIDFNILGDEDCNNPSVGIALDELFSYEIINQGAQLTVNIRRGDRDGEIIGSTTLNMLELNTGYDRSDEWMYFKAGIYTQNNRGNNNDGDIVTFYRLNNSHD